MALRGVTTGTTSGSGVNTLSVNAPSGLAVGDIVILAISSQFSGTDPAPVYPSGFGSVIGSVGGTLADLNVGGGGFWSSVNSWVVTGSPPANFTVTTTGNLIAAIQCWAFSGRSGFNSFVHSSASTSGTSPVTLAMTSGTASTGDDVLALTYIATGSTFGASETFTAGSGFGNATLSAGVSGSQSPPICGQCQTGVASGAVGTIAGTFTDGTLAVHYGYYVISLEAGTGASIAWVT
jgi:hypothetical protein